MTSDTPRTDAADWMWTPARAHPGETPIEEERVVDADFARQLERELDAMRQQRDEARREVCRYWALRSVAVLGVYRSALDFAADRGWDCYAKEGGGA